MKQTTITETIALRKLVDVAHRYYSKLDEKLADLKRECDHLTPVGKLSVKYRLTPKQRSSKRSKYKVCGICGEDLYPDPYGRIVSVWNHLDMPIERQNQLEEIMRKVKPHGNKVK